MGRGGSGWISSDREGAVLRRVRGEGGWGGARIANSRGGVAVGKISASTENHDPQKTIDISSSYHLGPERNDLRFRMPVFCFVFVLLEPFDSYLNGCQ